MALMFLSNLNSFNSSPSPPKQRLNSRKRSSSNFKVWKEKGSKWFSHFFSLSLYVFALLVCFTFLFLSQSSFMLCMFTCCLLVCFHFCFILFYIIFFFEKSEKYKNSVCLCILVLVYPGWPLKQSFLTLYFL